MTGPMDGAPDPKAEKGKDSPQSWLRFLKSMQFSFVLLFIIAAACVAGSVIPQGSSEAAYRQLYGDTWAKIITELNLDHVFTCWWFVLLTALLCVNLILCSVSRFPAVLKAWKASGKKSIGMWGSWITHLGMLLLIISFAAGQYTSREETVYGIAGSTQPLGGTGLSITIDSFDVSLREDNTVKQYTAGLTVSDASGNSKSGTASVNHPFDAFGYSFYQDSMGWAVYVDIYKSGEPVKTDLICAGEYTFPNELPSLVLMFNKFYPDLARNEDGSYYSRTPLPDNPHALYSVYYDGSVLGMGLAAPGTSIDCNEYSFVMRDPCEYTLIVAKHDPLSWLVGVSAFVLLAGLFISFYVRPWEKKRIQNAE